MTKVLFVSKPELDAAIQASNLSADYKKYLNHVWDNFNFNRTLNNYSLIKFHFDKSQAYFKDETYVLENKNTDADRGLIGKIGNFAKLDWKIEVTLSSIWMKKVIFFLFFYKKISKFLKGFETYGFIDILHQGGTEKEFLFGCVHIPGVKEKHSLDAEEYSSSRI